MSVKYRFRRRRSCWIGCGTRCAYGILAVNGHVSASTQNQALGALLFLYQQVLGIELPRLDAVRAKRPKRLPAVLCAEEVGQLLRAIEAKG